MSLGGVQEVQRGRMNLGGGPATLFLNPLEGCSPAQMQRCPGMAQVVRAVMAPMAKRFAYHGLKTLFRKYASSRNPPDWFGKRKVFLTVKLDRTWSGLTRLHARVGSARFRGLMVDLPDALDAISRSDLGGVATSRMSRAPMIDLLARRIEGSSLACPSAPMPQQAPSRPPHRGDHRQQRESRSPRESSRSRPPDRHRRCRTLKLCSSRSGRWSS